MVWVLATGAWALPLTPTPDWSSSGGGAVAVGDFDGDGGTDVAWASLSEIDVAWHDPVALLATPTPLALGSEVPAGDLAAVDVDADGYDDLIATSTAGGTRNVVRWQGGSSGFAGSAISFDDSAWPLTAVGDLDGDDQGDLAIGLHAWLSASGGPTQGADLPGNLFWGASHPTLLGDPDGDGLPDVLVPDHASDGSWYDSPVGPARRVWWDGAAWQVGWSIDLGYATGAVAVLADVDGDGVDELVSANVTTADELLWGTVTVLGDLGNPDGPVVLTTDDLPDIDIDQGFVLASLGDTDGDGADEVVISYGGVIRALPWDPTTGFDLTSTARSWGDNAAALWSLATADVDGDGTLDLVTSWRRGGAETAIWLTGPGPATTTPTTTPTETGSTETGDTGTTAPTVATTPSTPSSGTSSTPETTTGPSSDGKGGCGCSQTGSPGVGLLLLALAARRRRP